MYLGKSFRELPQVHCFCQSGYGTVFALTHKNDNGFEQPISQTIDRGM